MLVFGERKTTEHGEKLSDQGKNQIARQSQKVQCVKVIALAELSPKYSSLLGLLPVSIYLGSLPGLFPLAVCMFQGCIFIQGQKIAHN